MARARKKPVSPDENVVNAVDEERLRRELVAELERVRSDLRDTIAMYRMRLEGYLTQVEEAVSATDLASDDAGGREEIAGMLEQLRQLKVKPDKGRRRDLKRMEILIKMLRNQVRSW
ncbi:MAG: hypothetical protein Kow0047_21100 [Anaerolineae bacterium]